jgi:hypothetical protein
MGRLLDGTFDDRRYLFFEALVSYGSRDRILRKMPLAMPNMASASFNSGA